MTFIRLAVLCLLAVFAIPPASAQQLSDKFLSEQPSFKRMGDNCGQGSSQQTYSKSEYAAAYKEAQAALKSAQKKGQKAAAAGIAKAVASMQDCQKDDPAQYDVPPMKTCEQFGGQCG
ncbi:MAG: hypothetical protein NTW20_14980 [Rhodobacterales bacterium]|nr:hypothetical protein [Rhodobacterales bacterium]